MIGVTQNIGDNEDPFLAGQFGRTSKELKE